MTQNSEYLEPDNIQNRLERIEETLQVIVDALKAKQVQKAWYTTKEAAELLGKKPYTVREWCRLQRVNAEKAQSGRGLDDEWRISHDEIQRIRNSGLLQVRRRF